MIRIQSENVRINNTYSIFQSLLSGVLGQRLFNIFTNDLYLCITKTDPLNFADENTVSAAERTIENLISILKTESQAANEWFRLSEIIVNPGKFQAIIVKKNTKMKDSYPLNINDLTINSENSVKRLGIEKDNKLSFEQHISTISNKASNQLNAIGRIQKYVGVKEKEVHLNSFVYSDFN